MLPYFSSYYLFKQRVLAHLVLLPVMGMLGEVSSSRKHLSATQPGPAWCRALALRAKAAMVLCWRSSLSSQERDPETGIRLSAHCWK